jgi:hypothetical protein
VGDKAQHDADRDQSRGDRNGVTENPLYSVIPNEEGY